MDIKQLIESGSLELYVMEALPAAEMQQIDALRTQHPELDREIRAIETALQQHAEQQATNAPAGLKEKIAASLSFADGTAKPEPVVVRMVPPFYRYAMAASVALIVALAGTNYYFYSKYTETSHQLIALQSENTVLANRVNLVSGEAEKIKGELAVITNPLNKQVVLNGLPIAPTAKAVVYWNNENGSTYINAAALPAIAANEQFQLWAIVDGQPVDLGVISKDTAFSVMKQVKNAQAFAITLEPLGGKPTPTLEKMYVVGNV